MNWDLAIKIIIGIIIIYLFVVSKNINNLSELLIQVAKNQEIIRKTLNKVINKEDVQTIINKSVEETNE